MAVCRRGGGIVGKWRSRRRSRRSGRRRNGRRQESEKSERGGRCGA